MQLQNMFQKDINRAINGVIKVAQDDEESLKQELSEYIITRELCRHFRTFFDHYAQALDIPTDQIGVWISGFFGSGKSHFLKMISYLLVNGIVCGQRVMDYFADKFDDPMMLATAQRCAAVPTESILFNIDVEGPINKDKTAVLRVFAKMFYNHCGFYGDDLKIAKMERFIEKQGKTEAFRQTFEEVNGAPWVETRDSFAFFEDDVVAVLQSVLGIEDIKANIDNIAILMIDDIRTDKIALRASVSASLDRLLSQNYISRSGDTYAFLTDEEQDIAIDIKNTVVDSAQVIREKLTATLSGCDGIQIS